MLSALLKTSFGLTLMLFFSVQSATAQITLPGLRPCIKDYLARVQQDPALGAVPADFSLLIQGVAEAISLSVDVKMVACDGFSGKAVAYFEDGTDQEIPLGSYIVYEPTWIQQVVGPSRAQAIALFGHELGHLLNNHYTTRKGLTRLQKETEADHFAGCAAGAMNVEWNELEGLLSRIRTDSSDPYGREYPDRVTSLAEAKKGFDKCGGKTPKTAGTCAFREESRVEWVDTGECRITYVKTPDLDGKGEEPFDIAVETSVMEERIGKECSELKCSNDPVFDQACHFSRRRAADDIMERKVVTKMVAGSHPQIWSRGFAIQKRQLVFVPERPIIQEVFLQFGKIFSVKVTKETEVTAECTLDGNSFAFNVLTIPPDLKEFISPVGPPIQSGSFAIMNLRVAAPPGSELP